MAATPQTNTTLKALAEIIMQRYDFAICGHVNPDGDCLGSQLALARALQKLGKRVVCLFAQNDVHVSNFFFLPGIEDILSPRDFEGKIDTFIALDVPITERMGDAAAYFEAASLRITIDHHAVDTCISEYNYVDPAAAATAVLVWELIGYLGVVPDEEIACCAYTGLMTDTGRFQFQNADTRAFEAAAQMIEAGARPAAISSAFYQNRSLASVKLESIMTQHINITEPYGIALSWVSKDDMALVGANKEDVETLIDTLRSIRGVRVACLLREEENCIRASLRSKDDTDIARIARMFGGGGHKAAAGCSLHETLEDALLHMQATLERELG